MKVETSSPALAASPISGPAMRRASTAGKSVTKGASTARKTTSSSAMMKITDSSSVKLWVWLCLALASTDCASSPAKWICRPAGAWTLRTAPRI